jgi:hypothetical protein
MTQYQQVLAAIKKLGGKGTTDEIFRAIDDIDNWKTQTKKASVASYLSTSDDIGKDGDYWVYNENHSQKKDKKQQQADTTERGLYFITLNPAVKPPVPGLLFKIGLSDGKASTRLKAYGASLPYSPIQELGFYRIPLDVNIDSAEEQVRGELLGNDHLGFHIERFFGNHQVEWLQTLDLSLNEDDINKLAKVVNSIVKDTIDNLRKITN